MRTLDQGHNDPQWDDRLVNDLAFIKKHLRYPFSRRTFAPLFTLGLFFGVLARFLAGTLFLTNKHIAHNPYFIVAFVGLIICVYIGWYLQMLQFTVIKTPYGVAGNMQLLQQFLTAQNLAFGRHPQAPEVFQIMSKNMNEFRGETREVVIFIADDNRILINSSFIQKGFSITPTSRNYKQVANRLREWIKIHN